MKVVGVKVVLSYSLVMWLLVVLAAGDLTAVRSSL